MDIGSTTYSFTKLLSSMGKLAGRTVTFFACGDVVLSAPFFEDEQWKMISGNSVEYKVVTLESAEAASTEFTAFGNIVTFGDGVFDFYLLSGAEAKAIRNKSSYLNTLKRHKQMLRVNPSRS